MYDMPAVLRRAFDVDWRRCMRETRFHEMMARCCHSKAEVIAGADEILLGLLELAKAIGYVVLHVRGRAR